MSQNILKIAGNLASLISEHRDRTSADRRIAPEIVAYLRKERLAHMSLATVYGGLETHPVDALKLYECLAAEDVSVPWVLWNCSLVTYFSRFMNPQLRDEVFAQPDALFAQSTRPMGTATKFKDHFDVNGCWSLVSGCELADWLFLTCMLANSESDDVPKTLFVCVPKQDCQILDTLHVAG